MNDAPTHFFDALKRRSQHTARVAVVFTIAAITAVPFIVAPVAPVAAMNASLKSDNGTTDASNNKNDNHSTNNNNVDNNSQNAASNTNSPVGPTKPSTNSPTYITPTVTVNKPSGSSSRQPNSKAKKQKPVAVLPIAGDVGTGQPGTPASVDLPTAPTGLIVVPGNAVLDISWDSAPGDEAVSAWLVQWSLDGAKWTSLDKVTEPRARVEGLTNGVLVFVQVAAENAAGRGATVASSGVPSSPASAPRSPGRVVTPLSGDPYGDAVRADGPSAYWPMTDEPGAASARDAMGGVSLDGATAFGMPAPIGGTGAAYVNRKALTGAASVTLPGTVEAWVNVGSVNGDYAVLASVGSHDNGWELRVDSTGVVSLVSSADGTQSRIASSTGVVMAGAWYHVVVASDGAAASIRVNGIEVAAGVLSLAGGDIRFAADAAGENSLYGSIAHIAVYPSVLSVARTTAHFAASGYEPGTGNLPTARAGDTYAVINWASPTETGGARIIGYRVEMREGSGDWISVVDNSYSTSTAAFVSELPGGGKLVNGRAYDFRVRAMTQVGAGAPSDVVTVTPLGIATAPRSVNFTSTGNGHIEATWDAPENDGGSPITAYRVEIADDGATWWTLATTSADARTVDIAELSVSYTHLTLPTKA